MTEPETGLEEIRAVRHSISAEAGHDPRRLLDRYRELECKHAGRIVHTPAESPAEAGSTVVG